MSDSKKKRLSMLDSLAVTSPSSRRASSPAPAAGQPQENRALRAARNAVEGHTLWELDPSQIDSGARINDRLDLNDLTDLRDAIEENGQTVPILVRRDPSASDRYLLVYGRRRLEAIRASDKVTKVRALVANLDNDAAIRAQVSENMARRDLTFIERALFAQQLIEEGFGTQTQVAEVLTVTRSSVSMALTIVEMITRDLAEAIGSAQGIGRPRWEALAKAISETGIPVESLIPIAVQTHNEVDIALSKGHTVAERDSTVAAFNAVYDAVMKHVPPESAKKLEQRNEVQTRTLSGAAAIKRTSKGVRLDIPQSDFADWLEQQADTIFKELHDRWKKGG